MKMRIYSAFLCGLVLLLVSRVPAEATCSTECADGSSCSSNISKICDCTGPGGSACCTTNPCLGAELDLNATSAELSAFKAEIDRWSASSLPDVKALADSASNLYDTVFFKDRAGYSKARADFEAAFQALSPQARQELDRRSRGTNH
jgi:hypothetical protein